MNTPQDKSETQEKFQSLLRELFQFDLADLDFGIYRIMNHKRQVIERWITEDLPKAIEEELQQGVLAEQAQAQQALEEARQKVLETLGEDALDAEGNLAEQFHSTKVGREYLEARAKAAHAQPSEALEAAVYNHLYTFFSRYYQDGDFISKRRYSKKERYAIPYNGEEVYLYWANHDQYYVKTAEHFTDYTWKAPNGVTVHFKLQAANVEVNNVKSEKRFFLPVLDGMIWDAEARTLTIPFEYRPLTEQEKITYGKSKQQDRIIAEALERILPRLKDNAEALEALTAERRKDAQGKSVSWLAHHLRQYTARNTRDFFIHKDLKGFLSGELDFYLKNEVLNLDELEAAGESMVAGWFQLMRLIKRIGNHIIDFLAQIEDFQKALWEKKKFVTETFYIVTVGNIPEDFYPEIAANEAQWEEWGQLGMLSEESGASAEERALFIAQHPSLPVDTRHFSQDFADRLLASFENLDEVTDGLLVHSENWQALNLLLEKYRARVQCVHIDPPYNTQTSGFLYKNNYQHSSWLSMMENRSALGMAMLEDKGHFLCHIDDNEYTRLQMLLDEFGLADAGTIVWDKRNPMTAGRGIALQHEYVIWRSNADTPIYERNRNILSLLRKAKEIIEKHGGVTDEAQRDFSRWVQQNLNLTGGLKAYRYLDERGRIYQTVSLRAPEPRTDPKFFQPLIHPVTSKPCPVPPNGFSRTPETLKAMMKRGEIVFGPDETTQPRQKRFLTVKSQMQIRSILVDAKRGKANTDALGLETFPYSHPVSLYEELVAAATNSSKKREKQIVVDYFAGSGTTGHAVINLNREDASAGSAQAAARRKFILVEMGEYFDTVLLPRIKKVTFSPDWKNGKAKRSATQEEFERGPRVVKIIRLESYEDALNNISFDEESGQQALAMFGDEYLLRYMLKWESRKSETLLDVEKLQSPFSYKLRIHRDGETREQSVDLPETFNYLLGLDVATRQVFYDGERRYLVYRGTTREGRKAAVIWRETKDWQKEDYERDAAFVAEHQLAKGMDEVFVNGDSFIPGARSLDGVFKARLFGQEG